MTKHKKQMSSEDAPAEDIGVRLRKHLRDPVYIRRPKQIVKHLWYRILQPTGSVEARLPWGASLKVIGDEQNGRNILRRGVDQLNVTEACMRLMEPGGVGVDVGANYGQMTIALAHGLQEAGAIYAFEPHPFLFEYLLTNTKTYSLVNPIKKALSDRKETSTLHVPTTWRQHAGTSSLESGVQEDTVGFQVDSVRLDDEFNNPICVLKLDVERHELSVLRGASRLLSRGAIKHIIFEDHAYQKSRVVNFLEKRGYDIYSIGGLLGGPKLSRPQNDAWNFIATLDAGRLREKFARPGWRALGN